MMPSKTYRYHIPSEFRLPISQATSIGAIRLWISSTVSSVKFGRRSSNRITTIDTNRGTRHKIRGS